VSEILNRPDYGHPQFENKTLLQGQRNQVLRAIQAAGMNPAEFSWEIVDDYEGTATSVSKLVHRGGYFLFGCTLDNSFYFYRSPGEDTRSESQHPGTWGREFDGFQRWLRFLKTEVEEPDLWASIKAEKDLILGSSSTIENSPFSAEERKRLLKDVHEIKQFVIKTAKLTEGELSYVTDRLDYLVEASGRMGRKDWINVAVGTLINVVTAVALTPAGTRELFHFAGQIFRWIFESSLQLPV
jgi:hypothetical protein